MPNENNSDQIMDLKSRAIRAYEASELRQQDELRLRAENRALKQLLENLGIEADFEGSQVRLQDVTLTAHYDYAWHNIGIVQPLTPLMRGLGEFYVEEQQERELKQEVAHVSIRAHFKCPICDEMRHSDKIDSDLGGAAGLGQFFSRIHDCPKREPQRSMGFRQNQDVPLTNEGI